MPKLILKKKAEVLTEFLLKGTNSVYTIGSEVQNDIVIEDKMVSMTHLQIERHGNQYYARDLKSAFGTVINGVQVNEMTEIHDNTTIVIGDHTLIFRNPLQPQNTSNSSDETPASDFWSDVKGDVIDVVHNETDSSEDKSWVGESHLEISNHEPLGEDGVHTLHEDLSAHDDSLEKELSEVLQEAAAIDDRTQGSQQDRTVTKSPYYLLVIYGPYLGKKYQLNFGETKIGRDNSLNDIVIRKNNKGEVDPSISRRHATVIFQKDQFYLSDKRSKSRTYLNQDMLSETDELLLSSGDEVEIVSDQKSTIFRLVDEGDWDFSFPKRAGAWWLRYRSHMLNFGTIIFTVLGLIFGILGWYNRSILMDVPEPFQIENKAFTRINLTDGRSHFSSESKKTPKQHPLRPVLADLNGDSYVDLVVPLPDGALYALDGKTRKQLWRTNTIILTRNFYLTVADLNDDSHPDIIALTAASRLIAIDGLHGAEIWTSQFFAKESKGPAIVGDFNGDGRADVAIVVSHSKLKIGYAGTYSPEWVGIDLEVDSYAPVSCADLDNDGDEEILIGTERGLVLIYDGVERRFSGIIDINLSLNKLKGSFAERNQIRHPVGIADLNGDGTRDLIISSLQGNLVCLDISDRRLDNKFKVQELWWASLSQTINDSSHFRFPFVLSDIEGDGLADVVALTNDGSIAAFRGSAQKGMKQHELWRVTNTLPLHDPVLFDVNNDKRNDIIVSGHNGRLKILNGQNGEILWKTDNVSTHSMSHLLVADLKKDTNLDIVQLRADGTVKAFRTNRRVSAGSIAWNQSYGSAAHLTTGNMSGSEASKYNMMIIISLVVVVLANIGNIGARRRVIKSKE